MVRGQSPGPRPGRPGACQQLAAHPVRGVTQIQALLHQLGKAEVVGQGGGKEQPGVGHQAVVVEGDLDAVGVGAW